MIILAAAFGTANSPVKETAQLIFTSVLPLLGTWVGTVLAFYFTKESLEAASRTTMDVVRSVSQKLASINVTQAMMKTDDVVKATVASGKVEDLPLQAIDSEFKKPGPNGKPISRLLVIDNGKVCIGIIHRSIWMEMLVVGSKLTPQAAVTTDTLSKLLPENSVAGKKFDDIVKGTLAFVAADKTLADAKTAMDAVGLCQDVIVTPRGASGEAMLGWISNVDITRLSQA